MLSLSRCVFCVDYSYGHQLVSVIRDVTTIHCSLASRLWVPLIEGVSIAAARTLESWRSYYTNGRSVLYVAN